MHTPTPHRCAALFALFTLFTPIAYASATEIRPTTFDDNFEDNGDCSLREATVAANTNVPVDACPAGSSNVPDTILLEEGTYTISLPPCTDPPTRTTTTENPQCGDFDLHGDTIVQGQGRARTIIDAQNITRHFELRENISVTFLDIMFVHGDPTSEGIGNGGSINVEIDGGSLTVERCHFDRNTIGPSTYGGQMRASFGGAIFARGVEFTMYDSIVTNNTVHPNNLDIRLDQGQTTGVHIESAPSLHVERSLFAFNYLERGRDSGRGYVLAGRAVEEAFIRNNTFTANFSNLGPVLEVQGDATVVHNTIINNSSYSAPSGVRVLGSRPDQIITVANNIIYGNTSEVVEEGKTPNISYLVSGLALTTFNLGENNILEAETNENIILHPSNTVGVDPLLRPLQDHGGGIMVHQVPLDSIARFGAFSAYCPEVDQRGVSRLEGGPCDVGAYQANPIDNVERVPVPAGELCPNGGLEVTTSFDENGNGIIDFQDTTSTEVICTADPGFDSLVRSRDLEDGEDSTCPDGGLLFETGLDNGDGEDGIPRDGVLQDGEVDHTDVLCRGESGESGENGEDGEDGAAGADGQDGEPGAEGPAGRDGVDGRDGRDGTQGPAGEDGEDGAAGAAGADGGGCSTTPQTPLQNTPIHLGLIVLGALILARRRTA